MLQNFFTVARRKRMSFTKNLSPMGTEIKEKFPPKNNGDKLIGRSHAPVGPLREFVRVARKGMLGAPAHGRMACLRHDRSALRCQAQNVVRKKSVWITTPRFNVFVFV
jgi:hypothetical protein